MIDKTKNTFPQRTWNIGFSLALFTALALPSHAAVILPPAAWGNGTGYVQAEIPLYSSPNGGLCYINATGSCAINAASNDAPYYGNTATGTSAGMLSGFTNASGSHLIATATSSGSSETIVDGSVGFTDTLTNNTNAPEQYQLTLHIDASLYYVSTAIDVFEVNFIGGLYEQSHNLLTVDLNTGGGSGTYDTINKTFTTPLETIAANSSQYWGLNMSAEVVTYTYPNTIYPGGLPYGSIDAGNTLSLTGLSVFDANGNPLPDSDLASSDNYPYSSNSAAPEPATASLLAVTFLLLAWRHRRKLVG